MHCHHDACRSLLCSKQMTQRRAADLRAAGQEGRLELLHSFHAKRALQWPVISTVDVAAAVTVECRTERCSSSSTIFLGVCDGLQEHLKADVFALPIAVQPQDKVGAPLCLLLQVLAHMGLPQQALLIYQKPFQQSSEFMPCASRDPVLH